MMTDEDPKIWGSSFWIVMRKIGDKYPVANPSQEVQAASALFFESLAELLPCGTCRSHYKDLLKRFPVSQANGNRESLMKWIETIKSEVDTVARQASIPTPTHPVRNVRSFQPAVQQQSRAPPRPNVPTKLVAKSAAQVPPRGCSSCSKKLPGNVR